MKPIIGVLLREQKTLGNRYMRGVYSDVVSAVNKHGGIVIGIPNPQEGIFYDKDITNTPSLTEEGFSDMKLLVDMCDGMIFQGGDEYFDYDLKVLKYCYDKDMPILGICLGMQTMACLFDGEMIDIGNMSHKQEKEYVHNIHIAKDSNLYKILGQDTVSVNSFHKSKIIKTALDIVARSEDGIIEAVEDKRRRFFLGVQWHPERMASYDKLQDKIIESFMNACK
ncbi:MAG: gamma-glutamyl-gamma-aminobutyrate hydrolase family protein [Ignavibacteriales bacterium]